MILKKGIVNIDKSIKTDGPVIIYEKDGSGPTVGARVSDDEKADIKKKATEDGISESDWFRQAIEARKKFTENEFLSIIVHCDQIKSIIRDFLPPVNSYSVKGGLVIFIKQSKK